MSEVQCSIEFQRLFVLFNNVLPIYDRRRQQLYTRYKVGKSDLAVRLAVTAVMPAHLCVLDGQNLLCRKPMLYGQWRRNGLAGSASLLSGLGELLAPSQRRDDASLVMMADGKPQSNHHGSYFHLFRVQFDRLNLPMFKAEKLNGDIVNRTRHLHSLLQELESSNYAEQAQPLRQCIN